MIPKIIHYCWFGKNEKPKIIKKCIRSWKKYCPDYRIIEWNEENFDINSNIWCQTAYEAKKWAFVSDYVRLKVLYDYGGIYMDTDVLLKQSLNKFLKYNCFMGFQHESYVNNGLVTGALKRNSFIKDNLSIYENSSFIDENGKYKMTVCQEYTTKLLKDRGLVIPCDGQIQILDDIYIFPPEYFCPYDHRDFSMKKTKNTVAIHLFASSWWSKEDKKNFRRRKAIYKIDYLIHFPNRIGRRAFGDEKYEKLKRIVKRQ